MQIADALDAAHRRGLVHRDVKPANVLLDEDGHAYLTDFGITKQIGGASTDTGRVVGTLDYLAPEQIRGEKVDGRTDCYALACVLDQCLAGAPPFRRETEAETLWAHMQDPPPRLPGSPALDPVLAKALSKDKEQRYATCTELVAAASAALGFEPPARRAKRLRIGRRLLLAGAVLLLAVAVTAGVLELTEDGEPDRWAHRGRAELGGRPRSRIEPDRRVLLDISVELLLNVSAARPPVWVSDNPSRASLQVLTAALVPSRRSSPCERRSLGPRGSRGDAVWLIGPERPHLVNERTVLVKVDSTYGSVAKRVVLRAGRSYSRESSASKNRWREGPCTASAWMSGAARYGSCYGGHGG